MPLSSYVFSQSNYNTSGIDNIQIIIVVGYVPSAMRVDFPPQISVPQLTYMPAPNGAPYPSVNCTINGTAVGVPYGSQFGMSVNFTAGSIT